MSDERTDLFKVYFNRIDKKRRRKLKVLLYEDGVWKRFREDPASTKFHGSHKGGLLEHSILVTKNVFKLARALDKQRWTESTLALVGLFHDIGKCGNENQSYYTLRENKEGGEYYDYNRDLLVLPHSVRSVRILIQAGIKLSEEEWQAIQYHDGPYLGGWQDIKYNQLALTILLHSADMWATFVQGK